MRMSIAKFQIGKEGLTQGVINALNLVLKTHNRVRISVLKSSGRDKAKVAQLAEEICSKVEKKCVTKIVGFTIILMAR